MYSVLNGARPTVQVNVSIRGRWQFDAVLLQEERGFTLALEGRHLGQQCPRVGGDGDRRIVDYGGGVGIAHTFDYTHKRATRQGQWEGNMRSPDPKHRGLSEPFLNVFTW